MVSIKQILKYFVFLFLNNFLVTISKDFLGNGDSDDESDGEDVDRFAVKPQFQGEQGQKVF